MTNFGNMGPSQTQVRKRQIYVAKLRTQGNTYREIGEEVGVSTSRARNIFVQAVKNGIANGSEAVWLRRKHRWNREANV
jgi:uncharacterized protein YerC